jgi:hypothetical protein
MIVREPVIFSCAAAARTTPRSSCEMNPCEQPAPREHQLRHAVALSHCRRLRGAGSTVRAASPGSEGRVAPRLTDTLRSGPEQVVDEETRLPPRVVSVISSASSSLPSVMKRAANLAQSRSGSVNHAQNENRDQARFHWRTACQAAAPRFFAYNLCIRK